MKIGKLKLSRFVFVLALLGLGCRLAGAGCAFAGEEPTPEVAAVTAFLERTHGQDGGTAWSNVRVLAGEDAALVVERYFSPKVFRAEEDGWFARMKRAVRDGLACVYASDIVVKGKPLLYWTDGREVELPVGTEFTEYGCWHRFLHPSSVDGWGQYPFIGPRGCSGYDVWVGKADGRIIRSRSNSRSEPFGLPFQVRRLETRVKSEGSKSAGDVVVIADVEDVSFETLKDLNASHVRATENSYQCLSPSATYRIDLLVRKTEKGAFDFDHVAFVADGSLHQGKLYQNYWPFYRGLTLRVTLCRVEDSLQVVRVDPVLPYPPYSTEVTLYPRAGITDDSRFLLNASAKSTPKGAAAVGWVQYGDHTLAKFYTTTNDITGSFGSFPDYSRTARVEVWTAAEGANPDYWRTAWFADHPVEVHSVEEHFDEMTRLAFAWRGFHLWGWSSAKVRTLGDFVDALNETTVCPHCRQVHYRVVLADTLRKRPVSLSYVSIYVLSALKAVCEQVGCAFELKGREIVIVPELTDEELADTSLKGRLNILTKDGFASVVGADYVYALYRGGSDGFERATPFPSSTAFSFRCPYSTTGNGWRRVTGAGETQYLAYDAMWWTDAGNTGEGPRFSQDETKPRLARDIAKVRAYLREAVEEADSFAFRYHGESNDTYALAFALHLLQLGKEAEAQSIYEELVKRPGAAEAAFASLRQRVKKGQRDFRDLAGRSNVLKTEKEH